MALITINGVSLDPSADAQARSLAGLESADASASDYILIQTIAAGQAGLARAGPGGRAVDGRPAALTARPVLGAYPAFGGLERRAVRREVDVPVDRAQGLRGAEEERQGLVVDELVDAVIHPDQLRLGGLAYKLRPQCLEIRQDGADPILAARADEGAVQLEGRRDRGLRGLLHEEHVPLPRELLLGQAAPDC